MNKLAYSIIKKCMKMYEMYEMYEKCIKNLFTGS
jgi:hypothetical protein